MAGLKEALNTETVKKITLACDITSDESLFFERDVTLDMNGYELTVAKTTTYEQNGKTYTYHPVVIDKANVTIVNGNITVGKGVYANLNAILVTNRATLTLGTKSDETVVEDDRVFVTTNSGYGIVVSGGAALNMYGGSVTAKWSALGTNNTTGTAAFNVYGATLKSTDDSAIFMSCYTDVYLKDTAVIGKTAIDIRIGNLTVDGGSITSTYDGYHEMTYDEVTASGTLTGGDGSAILVKANYYYDKANNSNEVSIKISETTEIKGAVTIYDLDGVGNMLPNDKVVDQTEALQTFVDSLKNSHASVETHFYDVALPAGGSEDGTIVNVDKVFVADNESVTATVSSLDELRAAFAEKKIGKIVIGADFEISGNRIEIGDINDPNAATRSITLDLNGHTLKIGTIRVSDADSSANTAALYLGYNVSLTLTDTVGSGTIDASGANDLTVPIGAMRDGSTLIVERGTIIVDTDRESCVFARGGGKIVITGGTFINNCTSEYAYGGGRPLTVNIENNSTSTIDITGGTFKGRNPMSGDDNTDVAFVSKDSKVVEYKSGNMEVVAQNSEVTGDDVVAVYTYADNETGDTVATVYTEDALRAALADKNYDTVVLGADIGNASETFVIDRPVTLDLNGYTLENKNTTSGNYLLIEGGNSEAENIKVTIRNGNISSGDAAVIVMGYVDVVMENVSVKTDGRYGLELYGECDQSVTAEGCTFEGDTSGVAVFGAEKTGMTAAFSATDCTIKGGDYGVSGNGTYHLTTIDIVDSKVSSDRGTAIYHPQVGTLTISGGSEISGISGIEMRAGTLKISGNVSVVATAEEFSVSDLGDGPRFDGVALGVSRYFEGSDVGVTLDISGGTFVAQDKGYAFYEKDIAVAGAEDNTSLSFAGATFNGDLYSENETGFIKSGTFSEGVDLAYVADGQQVGVKSDGGMEVADEISGEGYDAIYSVSSDDSAPTTATVYTEDALNDAVNAGVNVVLGGDIEANVVIPADKTVTLDLNGYTLTDNGDHTIINNGTLTVEDSSTDKTGKVDNVTHTKGALVNYGVATLTGGTFTRSEERGTYGETSASDDKTYSANGNSWYTICNYGALTIENGTTVTTRRTMIDVTKEDGSIVSLPTGGFSSLIENVADTSVGASKATITISGGNFIGGLNTVKNDGGGVLDISGGHFENTDQHVILNYGSAEISGGEFVVGDTVTSSSSAIYTYGSSDPNSSGDLTITGGTFISDRIGVAALNGSDVTVSGSASFTALYAVVANNESTTIALNNGTYNGKILSDGKGDIDVSGGTFSEVLDSKYLSDSTALYIPTGDGASGYVVAPTSGAPEGASVVAAVMDGKGYASITEAIAAINDTEQHTITLVDFDGSNDETVTGGGVFLGAGDKNIVIDFNGLTYNVNTLVGSSGTESQLFHLEKGNTVTLKNGKIGVDEAVSKDVGMFIQNYSYLTLDGMTVDSSSYAGVSYTISNNNGSLTVTGKTAIKAAEGNVAFDVWYGMSALYYDGVTVTFDEGFTGTVSGKVEYGAATANSEWMEKTKIEFNSPDGVFDIDIGMSKNVPDATDANINAYGGTFSKGVDLAYVADGQKVGVKPGGDMEVGSDISGEGFDAIYTVSGDENASMSAIVYTADMFKKALDNDSVTEITLGKDFGGSYTIDRDVTIKAADGVTFSGNIVIESSSVTRTTGANVTIEGVAFQGNGSGTAISVKNGSLTMTGGSITNYDNGIVAGTRGGAAVDISVDNVTFTELDEKGIYGEAFGKLIVSGSTFNGAGNDASGAGNPYTGRSAAAIDINQTVAGGSVSITGNTFVDCGDNGSTSGAIKIKVRNIPVEQSYGQAGDFAAGSTYVGSFNDEDGDPVTVSKNTFKNCSRDIVVGTGYVADTYVEVVLGEGENANTSYVSSADDATTRDLIFVDNAHVDDAESLMNAFADEDLVLIEVFANITTTDIIVVDKPGKSVVLDLNGYTITANDTTTSTENGVSIGAGFLYLADGTLTVKDGTVNAIEDSFRVQTEATDDYAKLILADDLTVTSQNANAVYIRALNQQESTTPNAVLETAADLKVSGKYAAIQGNGTSTDGPVSVTVTGGDIVADPADETIDGTGLYLPGRGEYLITGGTITAPTGVEFRAGTLTITGGTITATGEFAADPNGNGATTSGVAVAMMQHTTERDLKLNITGGEFNGAYAVYQQNIQNNDSGTLTMSLTGGTFNGNVDSENCTEYISGGQYSVKPAAEAFDPGFDGVEYDGYYVVIKTTTDDIAALLAARIDAQADVRTYAAVLGIDWKAMEALADTDDVAAAALDAYNAIGNATSEGYVAIARSAAMDALDAYAAAMAESDALASAITDAQKEVREYAAARGYAWADIADTAVLDAYNAIASVQAVDGVDDAKADAISAVREYLDGLESSGAESELEAAKLKAQTTVKMYIASADIGGWTNLLLINENGDRVEKDAVAPIFAMYDMIEESTTVADIDAYMWKAISQVDTYVNALENWRKAAADEVTAAAQETAENANDAVVVPTSVYAAINGAVNYTEVNAYKTNALAEIADIRAYRADIAEQGSELDLIYGTLTEFKNAFDALDTSLTGENNAFDTLLKDVQDAITTAQNAITGGTDESSESLASIKSYLENTIYNAITAAQNAITSAIASVRTDIDALETALAGYESDFEGLSGTLAQINSSLGGKIDAAQADIDAIKTAIDALGTPASAAAVTELATAIDELKAAVDEISVSVSAPSAVETVKTEATADIAEWLNAYVDEIVNSVTASNGKAYAAAVTFAPALETTDGDLYAKLLKAFDKDNADLVLKYYNDALTAIDAATTADEVNTAVATFKAQVASVEAASGNTSDLTVVYVLLIVVLVVLVVAVVVAAVLSRKRRVPVGYAPAPTPAPAPATSETTEQTEKAAPAEKPEVTDDTAATAVEPDEAPDEDAGERVVINASVKTFDEAYDEMSDTLKDMFEKVREYALSKNGATGVRIGNGVRVKRGSKQIVKLTVRRGYPVAMFVLENEMLKDYRRTAGSSAKLKVPATELVLREPSDLDAAYMMVDLAVRQLDADVEAAKERRRELLRERRRQRREAMEAAKAAQAAQAEATTEQAEPAATEQNEAATPEQAVDEDKTE